MQAAGWVLAIPRKRLLRIPPIAFIQPKIYSIRLRLRRLIA